MSEWQPRGKTRKLGAYDWLKLQESLRTLETEGPRLVGDGPVEFSTSLALDLTPRIVWDTNSFYRSLGLTPDATRGQIKAAYLRLRGDQSARLTHIVKTLLNPHLRHRYDCTPLGAFWADDELLYPSAFDFNDSPLDVVTYEDSWAYYAWGVHSTEIDPAVLIDMRSEVAERLWRAGVVCQMAVGVFTPEREPEVLQVGYRTVAFFPLFWTKGLPKEA